MRPGGVCLPGGGHDGPADEVESTQLKLSPPHDLRVDGVAGIDEVDDEAPVDGLLFQLPDLWWLYGLHQADQAALVSSSGTGRERPVQQQRESGMVTQRSAMFIDEGGLSGPGRGP